MPSEINPYNAGPIAHRGSPFAPVAGEITEVSYELDIDDLVALALHNRRRSPTLRRQQIIVVSFLAMSSSGGVALILSRQARWTESFVFLGIFFLFFLLTLRRGAKRGNARLLRKLYLEGSNRALLGTRQMRISPEGLRYSSDVIETAAKWAAVEKIETTAEYAYFYIAAVEAYIIPRRAFSDERQFTAFVELARRYRQEALGEFATV